jgi:hypothetical protein
MHVPALLGEVVDGLVLARVAGAGGHATAQAQSRLNIDPASHDES